MNGFHRTIPFTIATDAVATDPIPVRGYAKVAVEVATFAASGANVALKVQGSVTSTTSTFKTIKSQGVYSAASGIHDWEVPQGPGNYIAECAPAAGFNYVRFVMSLTATAACHGAVHVMV